MRMSGEGGDSLPCRPFVHGRGDWIRTSDPLHPMQVRYQTALLPGHFQNSTATNRLQGKPPTPSSKPIPSSPSSFPRPPIVIPAKHVPVPEQGAGIQEATSRPQCPSNVLSPGFDKQCLSRRKTCSIYAHTKFCMNRAAQTDTYRSHRRRIAMPSVPETLHVMSVACYNAGQVRLPETYRRRCHENLAYNSTFHERLAARRSLRAADRRTNVHAPPPPF